MWISNRLQTWEAELVGLWEAQVWVWVLGRGSVMTWHVTGIRVDRGPPWVAFPPAAGSLLRRDCSEHTLQQALPAHTLLIKRTAANSLLLKRQSNCDIYGRLCGADSGC